MLTFFFSLPLQSYSLLPLFGGEAGGSRLTIGCRLLVRIVQRANQQADSPKDVRKERMEDGWRGFEWPGRGQGPRNVKTGATPTLTLHFQLGGIEFRAGEHGDKGTPNEPMNGQAEQKVGHRPALIQVVPRWRVIESLADNFSRFCFSTGFPA